MSAAASINTLEAAALDYAARGFPVFPCDPATKRPFTPKGFKDASTDADVIRSWWASRPTAMIAMPTGEAIGAWVLDVDDPETFEGACPIEIPDTRRCVTGKGYHLYFGFDPAQEVRNAQVKTVDGERRWPFAEMPGAEVRGNGGYIIVPPSLHPSGRRYEWTQEGDPVPPPAELLRIVRKAEAPVAVAETQPAQPQRIAQHRDSSAGTPYGLAALDEECQAIRAAGNGAQENTLNSAALKIGALIAGGELSASTAKAALISAGNAMPSYNSADQWTPDAITQKIERGLADGAATARRAPERMRFNPRPANDSGERFDPVTGEVTDKPAPGYGVQLVDFHAFMPAHNYIFAPSGETWPASSVNSRIAPVAVVDDNGDAVMGDDGRPMKLKASAWLDQNRPVEQMTWAPGEPQVVRDRLVSDGGWFKRPGCNVFNLYRPPITIPGDPHDAGLWVEHVRKVYPDEATHIIRWLAHRVQRPAEKINHALVMGGSQGIGKDTILEPVKAAIGPWNFAEVSPQHMLGRFNGFVKSVILRVSEARDLGDVDRFAFYDHMKTYTAAPPDVLRVDEKNLREYSVFNVCGVIITTNHKTDGIYLPADDRRHFVAWSNVQRSDFDADYWTDMYAWYANGGIGHVVAYLASLLLDDFDAKAPPPKTPAFWDIVSSNQAPEEAELADALEVLSWPNAVTINSIASSATEDFAAWLRDRRNSRAIPHKLDTAGYVAVRNDDAKDGLWRVGMRRCAIYARRDLARRDAIAAAQNLSANR